MLQLCCNYTTKVGIKYPKNTQKLLQITTHYYKLLHKIPHFHPLTTNHFDVIRPLLRLTTFIFYFIFTVKYMSKFNISSIKMADFGKNICLNVRNICLKWTISTMFLTYILHSFIDKYKNYFLAKSNLDIYFSI